MELIEDYQQQDTNERLRHYPSLTDEEFAEACRALERRCHDTLHGTNWLSVQWKHADGGQGELLIKQARAKREVVAGLGSAGARGIDGDGRDGGEICKGQVCGEKGIEIDEDEDNDEDGDMDAVVRHRATQDGHGRPAVDFSILVSPTYRVPVLWFALSSTKIARVQDLEEIYSRVVDAGAHEALRGIGIMGGISLANHPITDRPTFFVHPCNTPEAMVALNDGSDLDPLGYLLLWFGVVGSGIGLHVPSQVAAS